MKQFWKRSLALFLIFALLCTAFACGNGENGGSSSAEGSDAEKMTSTEPENTESETEKTTESVETSSSESETTEETTTEETSTTVKETSEEDAEIAALKEKYTENLFIATAENGLNVREGANTSAKIVGRLPKNAFGTVLETADGWLKVKSGDVEGYASAEFAVIGEEALALALSVLKNQEGGYYEPQEAYVVADSGNEGTDPGSVTPPPVTPHQGANGLSVCIDAGHQQHGISEMEPNGPGSTVMKAKLTTGTAGCVTGATEFQVNLDVSLKLQAELERRGYTVVMIRTTNDCPLSNAERAQVANQYGVGCFIRVHCNSSNDPSVTGAMTYAPSPANPYLSADLVSRSNTLSQLLLDDICAATGARKTLVLQDDGMTGINWCQVPVSIVEMGFMSNPDEDRLLSDPNYQQLMAVGMANGIDRFFGR